MKIIEKRNENDIGGGEDKKADGRCDKLFGQELDTHFPQGLWVLMDPNQPTNQD